MFRVPALKLSYLEGDQQKQMTVNTTFKTKARLKKASVTFFGEANWVTAFAAVGYAV